MEHAVKHEKPTAAGAEPHHAPEPHADTRPNAILQLQQQAGNQAVQELLRARIIQAKLTVSQPGDPEEQEADAMADHIMRSHVGAGAAAMSTCSCSNDEEMCEECRQQQSNTVMRKSAGAEHAPALASNTIGHILRSPGQPLDFATRAFFEPRFGRDFSDVRVHTDSDAAETAAAVDAKAYTAGQDVVFGEGQYSPNSPDGMRLLAHELVHTVQQLGAGHAKEPHQQKEAGDDNKRMEGNSPAVQRMVVSKEAGCRYGRDQLATGSPDNARTLQAVSPRDRTHELVYRLPGARRRPSWTPPRAACQRTL